MTHEEAVNIRAKKQIKNYKKELPLVKALDITSITGSGQKTGTIKVPNNEFWLVEKIRIVSTGAFKFTISNDSEVGKDFFFGATQVKKDAFLRSSGIYEHVAERLPFVIKPGSDLTITVEDTSTSTNNAYFYFIGERWSN